MIFTSVGNQLITNMLRAALQKAAFYVVKDNLLGRKRRSFRERNGANCISGYAVLGL